MAGMFLFGMLGGFLMSLRQTALYEAHVTLEIENPSDSAPSLNLDKSEGGGETPEAYLPTQVVILQSRTLQQHVRERLAHEKFSAPAGRSGRLASLARRLHLLPPKPTASKQSLPSVTVSVKVTPGTRIVDVNCDSADPRAAADYANALANEYIDSNLQAQWDAINHAREWLAQQLEDTRAKLQKSEDDLQAYGRASNLMFTGDKQSVEQDKLKQIQDELSTAEADRIAKQSAYQIAVSTPADSVPQVLDNARLSEYQAQLADLRRQLAELNSVYTSQHPKVLRVQAQIDQLESTFKKERDNVLTRVRNEYQGALMRERLLNGVYHEQAQIVSEQTQKTVTYSILERDVKTNRQLYDTLLQKSREADIATAMRGSRVRIVDAATPPSNPFKPKIVWNSILGSLSGLLAGFALIFVREQLDRSFKFPGDASIHLNLPELGVIPQDSGTARNGFGKTHTFPSFPPLANSSDPTYAAPVELAMWREKSSPIAESFRNVVASVLNTAEHDTPRVIVVGSAARGEGKTTVVSNLGLALAETNRKVLLIDGDLRRPRLNLVLNVPNNWGLSDLLREKSSLQACPLEALVRKTEVPDLYVLTSGPGTKTISNLLYSDRMLELLQRLRCEFDCILIDTPPMLDISDARVLGRLADAAILVCRAGKTNREAAMAAKSRLTADGIPVLGTILNAWDLKSMGRYGYSSYEYYYEGQQ